MEADLSSLPQQPFEHRVLDLEAPTGPPHRAASPPLGSVSTLDDLCPRCEGSVESIKCKVVCKVCGIVEGCSG